VTDPDFDPRRRTLCSRSNADRIAQKMCEETAVPFAVVRTDFALQPYRVVKVADTTSHDTIELEVMTL
jgi:hypothetical protein